MLRFHCTDLPEGKEIRIQDANDITVVKSVYDEVETLSYLGHAKRMLEDYIKKGHENDEKSTLGFPTVEFAFIPIGVQMKTNVSLYETRNLICKGIQEVKKVFR